MNEGSGGIGAVSVGISEPIVLIVLSSWLCSSGSSDGSC